MKFTAILIVVLALFSATVVECKAKKTLVEITTKGKIVEIATELQKMVNNGLTVEDIITFTPHFEKAIPDLIEQAVALIPILKEFVGGQLKEFAQQREKKMIQKVNNYKEALPRIKKQGFSITKAGKYGPRLQITESQFQTYLDIVQNYLKHVEFADC